MGEAQEIQLLGTLEEIRVTYKRRCSLLSKQIRSLAILQAISIIEQRYIALYNQLEEALRLI